MSARRSARAALAPRAAAIALGCLLAVALASCRYRPRYEGPQKSAETPGAAATVSAPGRTPERPDPAPDPAPDPEKAAGDGPASVPRASDTPATDVEPPAGTETTPTSPISTPSLAPPPPPDEPLPPQWAVVSWEAPSVDEKGGPLEDLAGFKVYFGLRPNRLKFSIDAGMATSYTFRNLPAGLVYFAVKAYDAQGNESAFSEVVSKLIPAAEPGAGKAPATSPQDSK